MLSQHVAGTEIKVCPFPFTSSFTNKHITLCMLSFRSPQLFESPEKPLGFRKNLKFILCEKQLPLLPLRWTLTQEITAFAASGPDLTFHYLSLIS